MATWVFYFTMIFQQKQIFEQIQFNFPFRIKLVQDEVILEEYFYDEPIKDFIKNKTIELINGLDPIKFIEEIGDKYSTYKNKRFRFVHGYEY